MTKKKQPTTPKLDKQQYIFDDYDTDLGNMESVHASFWDKEKILLGKPIDKISETETFSRVTDPSLISAILKQNNTTMAQMPSGKVVALTKQNKGKSLFMDLILREHIIPHATTQTDVFTKLWMMSFYREIYGSVGVVVDMVDKTREGKFPKGYIGPDFWVAPARAIIPQSGKVTVEDSDYTNVRAMVGKSYVESRDPSAGWRNLDKILATDGDQVGDTQGSSERSYVEQQTDATQTVKNQWQFVTRYEQDRWVTFHPASRTIVREIGNPQKNDQIPVVMCHSYPLLDRFFGLGSTERGSTLYAAQGGLINLILDGMKAGYIPDLMIDPTKITNYLDIAKNGRGPGTIWLKKANTSGGVEQMPIRPDMSGFQSTYQFLKASILTVTGTTDTSVASGIDVGHGKTPEALKQQGFTQAMQAQFSRHQLEISVEKIYDRMIDLIAKNGKEDKEMKLYLKEADLNAVKEVAPDVVEMFETGDAGFVKIKQSNIANVEYRYEIDQGSTLKTDETQQNSALKEITEFVLRNIPQAAQALAGDGLVRMGSKSFDLGEAFKRITISSGVTDWDKIIIDTPEPEEGEEELLQENLPLQEAFGDMGGQNLPPIMPQGGQMSPQPQGVPPMMEQSPMSGAENIMAELQQMAGGGQ